MLFNKISIIGVGLIGGSIGMAAKKKKIARHVVGVGRRLSSISKAKKLGAVDEATLDLKKGIGKSNLIIVAAPTDIVIKKIKECVKYINSPTIIIDVASVKEKIVKEIDNIIKNKKLISFIGTHPMAGSEETGVSMARPDLFNNSICIITPSKHTKIPAANKIKGFWRALGAKVEVMSPDKHDFAVAKVSHLPHMLAYNLVVSCSEEEINLAGPGFKDSTRIARSNPKMWAEIFIQNKANIIKAKKIFDKNIKLLESYIARKDKKGLLTKLTSAKRKRDSLG